MITRKICKLYFQFLGDHLEVKNTRNLAAPLALGSHRLPKFTFSRQVLRSGYVVTN